MMTNDFKKQVLAEPWNYSPEQHQLARGINEPWIAEISPWQYQNLGRRAKSEYDRNRKKEWSDSAAAKDEWRLQVIEAFVAKRFEISDCSIDAKNAIYHWQMKERDRVFGEQFDAAKEKNVMRSFAELMVGDRVYGVMCNSYIVVVKRNTKTLRGYSENDALRRVHVHYLGSVYRLSPRDLEQKVMNAIYHKTERQLHERRDSRTAEKFR